MPNDLVANQESKHRTKRLIAVAALVIVNALWGLSFPIMKSLNQQMEQGFHLAGDRISTALHIAFTSGMIGLRFAIAFCVLCFFCPKLVRGASRMEWIAGAYVGLFFYAGLMLQVMGLATIPASRSGFLTSLTAVFTPILFAILFRVLPSWNVVVGVLLALFGVSILTGLVVCDGLQVRIAADSMSKWTLGDTLTTLGSVLFTGQLILVDYYGRRINSAAITPGMFLVVIVAASITFLFLHRTVLSDMPTQSISTEPLPFWASLFLSPMYFGLVVFLAVFCSVLAFLGMNRYQPDISAVQASIIYSTEPVFASLWALWIPGILTVISPPYGYANELLSLPLLIGGTLILFANIVSLWPRAKS